MNKKEMHADALAPTLGGTFSVAERTGLTKQAKFIALLAVTNTATEASSTSTSFVAPTERKHRN